MTTSELIVKRIGKFGTIPLQSPNYHKVIMIQKNRQQTLAIRWIIATLKERSEKTIIERLSNELLDL